MEKNSVNLLPYERLKKYGEKALSDEELLAIILRNGIKGTNVYELSNDIINNYCNKSLYNLMKLNYDKLINIKGIGEVKAIQLLALSELVKRLWISDKFKNDIFFISPKKIADYYMQELRSLEYEEVRIAFLNNKNRFLSDVVINKGSIDRSLVSIRNIIFEAIKRNSINIVMIHNHPSGDSSPSVDDKNITNKVYNACNLCEIKLLDHIIIGDNNFYSFRENGDL